MVYMQIQREMVIKLIGDGMYGVRVMLLSSLCLTGREFLSS